MISLTITCRETLTLCLINRLFALYYLKQFSKYGLKIIVFRVTIVVLTQNFSFLEQEGESCVYEGSYDSSAL